ncbi:hypothetical protein pipiens_008959 [Culex pipiens pipiens]|uniref:Uncharacterized protein n=1 Tax=Culex pipiens pipiens TaxID=38569 RepID=A0ABD1DFR4_CULPP
MRHPSRGATSQKLLIFAVLLATSIRQILRPVQARTLLPSLGSFNGDDNNTGYSRSQDETSSAEVFNGTQLFLEEEVVELTNSTLDLEEREEEPSSSYVLVVVQTANLELLHRELLSFEQLFSTSKFRRKVRFRRWKAMECPDRDKTVTRPNRINEPTTTSPDLTGPEIRKSRIMLQLKEFFGGNIRR